MSLKLQGAQELFKSLPRTQLGFFPTPFYKLENLSAQLGINLYIKRDDFTGMNLFGGNKVRKLEFLLGQAKAQGCEYAITYGATQSNPDSHTYCLFCGYHASRGARNNSVPTASADQHHGCGWLIVQRHRPDAGRAE